MDASFNSTDLTGSTCSEKVQGLTRSLVQTIVAGDIADRTGGLAEDGKNRRVVGQFQVLRFHADHEAALEFVQTHTALCFGVASLVLGTETLTNCHLRAEGRAIGAQTVWNYQYDAAAA